MKMKTQHSQQQTMKEEEEGSDNEDFGFVDDNDDDGEDDDEDATEDEEEEEDERNQNKKRTQQEQGGKASKVGRVKGGEAGSNGNLYKPPTMDELNMLKETQMLYHSNLFRMQMEEVLAEVSMKGKRRLQFTQWLAKLSSLLTSLPESSSLQLSDENKMVRRGVCDPTPHTMPRVTGSITFAPPQRVEAVGSFASGTVTTLYPTVDVMMVLPKKCINMSDWRNGRWLAKRVKYLSWVAEHLTGHTDIIQGLSWTTHLGETCRPVLQVTPSGELGKKWRVNLFPVPGEETLKMSRFSPERSNLQPKWFFGKDVDMSEQPATPHYNWACGVDVAMQHHHQLIVGRVGGRTNLCQGIQLIKIWLAQRQLDRGLGCFSGHVITLFVIYLLQTHKINTQMSPYQVFRNAILSLNSCDWCGKGVSMCSTQADQLSLEAFVKLYEVVFVDQTGLLNLTASMITADWHRIQHESQLAIAILDSSSVDSFESLFIKKVETLQMSDQLMLVRLQEEAATQALSKAKDKHFEHTLDWLGDVRREVWSCMLAVLREGLGDRTLFLAPSREASPVWPVNQPPPALSWSLEVGLILDPTAAGALLTKGPSAESPEVEHFKEFWGELSSLRRFQDGSFHEAVLWGGTGLSQAQRRLIPGRICKNLLMRHFGVQEQSVHYVDKQLEQVLHSPEYKMAYEYSTGEEPTQQAIQAFDSLSRTLRSLDLPLKITAIQSCSDVNRHSRVFPPLAKAIPTSGKNVEVVEDHLQFSGSEEEGPCAIFKYAMEVVIFLEISGKWPEDTDAIQAIKAEFHLKMSELLEGDGITVVVFPQFLQISWMGYFFRVRVCYLREIFLQRLVQTADGDFKEQETPASLQLEKEIEILPRLTTAIASMQSDHPSFSAGVRLCKRWAASQLLTPHIPPIAVELLATHLYISPAPYAPPHSPHAAFLRFLRLLEQTDWKTTPILVNLNDEFSVEDITEINRRFISQRASLPDMFVATPYDLRPGPRTDSASVPDQQYKHVSLWTKGTPSLQILYRSKQLAAAALTYLTNNLLSASLDVKTIFRPSFSNFNVVLELNTRKLNRHCESIDWQPKKVFKFRPYEKKPGEVMPIVMFDCAQMYLKELQEAFSHLALFFYDEHGGDAIGVVWKPQAFKTQDLKVGSMEGHQLVGVKEVKQVPNLEAILEDFHILGADLVNKVTVNNT